MKASLSVVASLIFLLGVVVLPAAAVSYQFSSPEEENRFYSLSQELRCLVCQNQSLADSSAELAGDLRDEVYAMLKSGRSDAEIVNFLVAAIRRLCALSAAGKRKHLPVVVRTLRISRSGSVLRAAIRAPTWKRDRSHHFRR